ncbi:MAG TPA: ABC transporter permease [Terriglobia bacterium]|nr:ABC transporter permease [Terriglobia bacterium]
MFGRLRVLGSRIRGLVMRRRLDEDFRQELQSHFALLTEENIRRGLPLEEARRAARVRLGGVTQLRETQREAWGLPMLETLFQDIRYALRMLRKNPGFTAVAALTLALGIGANTIIFSTVYNVLLRSLPYPQSDRLFAVWSLWAPRGSEPMHVSAADFYDWQTQSRAFESLSAHANWPMNLTNIDEPRRLETQLVTTNLFSTLGVNAQIGRTFAPGEDQEGSASVVVISHHLWRTLGESPQIVGRELTLNGSPATVIGVMPSGFTFPSPETDAWVPLSLSAQNRSNREGRWLAVIGRLGTNVTRQEATTEMGLISRRLATAYPATNRGWSASLVPLQEELVGKTRPILLTLQAGGLLLLLITCANLANLLLAKAASRSREIGLRAALGAGRMRILRQLIVESTVLAALGGGAGVALAALGIELVRAFGDGLIPRADDIRLSAPVALFALAATSVTALISGSAPALQASRANLWGLIASGARGTPRALERKRGLLVAIEIALACVLLVGTGLLGKSLARLLSTAPGLRTDHVLTMQLTLPHSKYPTNAAQISFFQQILERTQTLPGVAAAGEISDTPLRGNNPTFEFVVKGLIRSPSEAPIQAGLRLISAGYRQAAGIPLRQGRDFTTADRAGSPPVAIVNEAMARRYWPGSNPVGRTLCLKDDQRWMEVVGVIPDVKHMGLKADEGPVVYIPYAQKTQDWLAWTTLIVRTAGEPMDSVPVLRRAIRGVDKNQPVAEIGTLEEWLSRSTLLPRFTTWVSGAVSGLALLLAVVGVYGLLAYTVAQRTPEFGIRSTLGASPLQLCGMLLRQAMPRVLAGVGGGLLGAWWLARGLESLLFGVRPHDPATFATVAGLLVLASLAAILVPARRVMKIDPLAALRVE